MSGSEAGTGHADAGRMGPAREFVHRLATQPRVWNLLRRVLEANFRGEKAVIRRELLPHAGAAPRVLDLGCGTGELAPVFLRHGYAYDGIDVDTPRIAYARAHFPGGAFQVMDAAHLAYPDAAFDQVLVTGVFHHLPDAVVRAIVAEMRRVLRPGGRVLVMEDTPPPPGRNPLGGLVHRADEGGFIRRPAEYAALFRGFAVRRAYRMRSGVCDYQVFVLEAA